VLRHLVGLGHDLVPLFAAFLHIGAEEEFLTLSGRSSKMAVIKYLLGQDQYCWKLYE